jgi:hypothetical protein
MPAFTVADVDTLMRKLLGDTNPSTGDLYTDTYNIEYIQSAYRYVARELCTAGVTLFRKQTASWTLPTGVTSAGVSFPREARFSGAGLNDMTFGGNYSGAPASPSTRIPTARPSRTSRRLLPPSRSSRTTLANCSSEWWPTFATR